MTLHIDCDNCALRGQGCSDCVVSLFLGAPPELELDEAERRALGALADGGLAPPLRLIPLVPKAAQGEAGDVAPEGIGPASARPGPGARRESYPARRPDVSDPRSTASDAVDSGMNNERRAAG